MPRKTKTKLKAARPRKKASKLNKSSERFVKDLLVRGEAAKPTKDGKLPLDATHVITSEDENGNTKVRRVRLKYF